MHSRLMFGAGTLAAILAVGSCKDDVGITSFPERYVAFLSGANEATPVTTPAQGLATVTVNGNTIHYTIELSSIDSAFLAHIHHAAAGTNGPVRVNLYLSPPSQPTDTGFSGVLVDSTVTVADSELAFIRAGAGYVNVHTRGPTAADGSGGHGGGEIRGQLFRFQ
jgi:hypothetical protein